jgi:hypothetical protein
MQSTINNFVLLIMLWKINNPSAGIHGCPWTRGAKFEIYSGAKYSQIYHRTNEPKLQHI